MEAVYCFLKWTKLFSNFPVSCHLALPSSPWYCTKIHKHTSSALFASWQDLYSDQGWWFILVGFSTDPFQMWNEFYWHLLVTGGDWGWLPLYLWHLCSAVASLFLSWWFSFKKSKNKRKTKGKDLHSIAALTSWGRLCLWRRIFGTEIPVF